MHAQRIRRHGDPNLGARNTVQGTCTVDGCETVTYCRGYCHGHYQRARSGRALAGSVRERNFPTDEGKRCPSCKETKPLDQFGMAKGRRSSWCRSCAKYSVKKSIYGVSKLEFDALMAAGCAICRTTDRLVIDHHHTTGKVRGALCANCNVALGMADDDPDRLEAMAAYLRLVQS